MKLFLLSTLPVALVATASAQVKPAPGKHSPDQTAIHSGKPVAPPGVVSTPSRPATQHVVVGGSDSCVSQDGIAGVGTFAFDNSLATTGLEGQNEINCDFFGTTNIDSDVWFCWLAPASGNTVLSLCGGTTIDSKVAVYPSVACGCPVDGTSLACNDDFCGLQTQLSFIAIGGERYTIQLGNFPGSTPGSGTFTISQPTPPTNDTCLLPATISGAGTFPFDNSLATTGAEGQTNANCNFFGSTMIHTDVWYQWTSDFTGTATLTTCAQTTVDTKIAVYDVVGCPTTNAAVACNDDACGLQTSLSFSATNGSQYMIQLGTFPNAAGGTGTFTIAPPPPNDSCATPNTISGTGTFPFSTLGATTGAEGQANGLCLFFGSTAIDGDVWYTWMAPSSGQAALATCSGTTMDSKIAVYDGAGCPANPAIACNDDACGLQTAVCFPVTANQTYTIQLGSFPGASTGAGTFSLNIQAAGPACTLDDGSTENLLGWTAGGEMAWLNSFASAGDNTILPAVQVAWGSAMFPGFSPGDGSPATVAVWDDPDDDGNPSNATLLALLNVTVQSVDTDTFITYPLPCTLNLSGVFFVGAGLAHNSGQFVAPMDQSGGCVGDVAWFFGNNNANPVNYTNPAANAQPPATFASIGLPAIVLVRGNCTDSAGTGFCYPEDAAVMNCPCSNPPLCAGSGCNNSGNTGGATLVATGTASLGNDTLTLTTASQMSTLSILMQGTTAIPAGVQGGQGVRCVNGHVERLFSGTAVGGSFTAPPGAGPSISAESASRGDPISAGQVRHYMVYYRDPTVLGGCLPQYTYNGTPAVTVLWGL